MAKVEYDPGDLLRFISRNFAPLNAMMERAGFSKCAIYDRTREIFHHFHLPFDTELPGSAAKIACRRTQTKIQTTFVSMNSVMDSQGKSLMNSEAMHG